MNDTLSTSEIKKRSLTGAKWLILTHGFGMPAAYLIALILGRTGPATLGAYALAQIFIGVITTFAMFGGPAVLRNFMPKISGAEKRGRFLFSYGLILAGLMLAVLTLFYFFPSILEFLLQREFSQENYGWFVLLTVVVVGSQCLMGAASGLMNIKLAAIARLMARIVILPLVAGLFLFNRLFLLDHATETILAGFLVAYGVGAILCVIGIWRDPRFQMRFGWLLPSGFAAFALTSSAAMVFSFLYGNFDRICVLGLSDLKGLGMYQAVISLALLIEFLPRMISTALVPMFSSLLASNERGAILRAYNLLQRAGSTVIFVVAIGIIAFSAELLSLFGSDYAQYDYLLVMFCVQSVMTSLFLGNTAILISYEKNLFRFGVSCGHILLQVLLTFLLLDTYGVFAIAGAKVTAIVLAVGMSMAYICFGLNEGFRIPRTYWAGVVIAIIAAIVRIFILPAGWLTSTTLLAISLVSFGMLSDLTISELRSIIALLISPKKMKSES